ncbi:PAP2 family protein [Streptococcus pneumoniae]|nr:PAP2 family protein [Streptococcus pneumoniae]
MEEKGFSFPSGHSLAVTLMVGTLIVILSQRIKDPVWRKIVQIVLGLYLVSGWYQESIWEFTTHQMFLPVSV